jgi:phage gp36-like protein
MSTFLTLSDYTRSIPLDLLVRITGGTAPSTPNTDVLDQAEEDAIEYLKGYLHARYDVAAIFAATGDDRNPIIVKYTVDVALFYIYHRMPTDQVPEMRAYAYEAAEKWLVRVQKQQVNPPDLPVVASPEGDAKEYVQFGSNPRRRAHLN